MSQVHHSRITELALKALENLITPEEFAELDSYIAASKEDAKYFVDCLATYMAISDYHETASCKLSCFTDASFDRDLWQMLSEAEVSAPAIELHKVESRHQSVQKVVYEKVPARINKISLITAISCAAALLFLILVVQFADSGNGPEVATLVDSVKGKWASPIANGTRLAVNSEPLFLQEGIVELLFDDTAKVVIEAPAEFQILAEDRIGLAYGKVYAAVPHNAIGFSVYTRNAKIIDLGTEFGIQVDSRGDTYLHMIKGQTQLITGRKSEPFSLDLHEGNAKRISADTETVTDIPCNTTFFVRKIDSRKDVVWKGETFDLTDIFGGGNGLGTGKTDTMIDPISGKPPKDLEGRRRSSNDYRSVPSNSYIDGVFVPNGRTTQVISSQGHVFRECPVTSALCCYDITNALRTVDLPAAPDSTVAVSPEARCLLMHANTGITFDLQAMRGLLPDVHAVGFQSKIGIEKWPARPTASNADFWVLVDGQLRFAKKQVKTKELYSVDIALSERDRFLTLIITEGDDPEERILNDLVLTAIDSDWGMFVDPVLVLK